MGYLEYLEEQIKEIECKSYLSEDDLHDLFHLCDLYEYYDYYEHKSYYDHKLLEDVLNEQKL